MKVNVYIDRSAAILAGREVFGVQQVDLDLDGLSQEQRAAVASAPIKDGVPDLTVPVGYLPDDLNPKRPVLAEAEALPWLEWRVEALRAIAAQTAKEKAAFEASVERFIEWAREQPAEAFLKRRFPGVSELSVGYPEKGGAQDAPALPRDRNTNGVPKRIREALADQMAQAQILADARNAEAARAEQARAAEREAAEQRRAQQIAAWVAEHMDDNARERFALGLLSEKEILDGMRDAVFRCMDDVPRYRRIGADDLDHEETCYGDPPKISCETENAKDVDAATFDAFRLIRDAAPKDSTLCLVRHTCTCDECDARLVRFSVDVSVELGELTLERKFAVAP